MFFKKGIIIAAISLFMDQFHKWYMIDIYEITPTPVAITPFLNFVMVWNPGISFGMFQDSEHGQYIFSALSSIITIILLIWLHKTKSKMESIALALIIGGAIGNIIDRVRFGAVADFFDFYIGGYHWPSFNIADSFIFIGAILLCIYSLFYYDESKKEIDLDEQKTTTD